MAALGNTLVWESQTPMPSQAQRAKDPEWERKQRQREYRVAARREKRNRKADEKKQRKLNATLLRRMTRNPEKYTKNADRNRQRDIESERRSVRMNAVRQAERLAAIHDQSGKLFNVGPVTVKEDGTVVSLEALRIREQRQKERAEMSAQLDVQYPANSLQERAQTLPGDLVIPKDVNPERFKLLAAAHLPNTRLTGQSLSKTKQKKLARQEPLPSPPKPVLPEHIQIPEGEENWIALWDMSDEELYRRVVREKKRKTQERKALRQSQKTGKAERRVARDEKRRVYRELKETWKVIKADEKRIRQLLKRYEESAMKKIAVELNDIERRRAMDRCTELGFTFANTEGVAHVAPKVYGLKGRSVDFENLAIGDGLEIRPKGEETRKAFKSSRVDLSTAPREASEYIGNGNADTHDLAGVSGDSLGANEDTIEFDIGQGMHHEELTFNHHLRRKIRRALDAAQVEKETLVRKRTIEHCEKQGIPIPQELRTPVKLPGGQRRGQRLLENGTVETAKQERVRARLDLTEFNNASKVLRRQAKEIAVNAGLRIYAEKMGRIPPRQDPDNDSMEKGYGEGWHIPLPPKEEDAITQKDITIWHSNESGLAKSVDHIRDEAMYVDSLYDSDQSDILEETGFELHGTRFC